MFEYHEDILTGEERTNLFLNLHPKPKTVSQLKVALKNYGTMISANPINKAVPSFRNSLA